jgi:membrane-associated phospholipid phosphatase
MVQGGRLAQGLNLPQTKSQTNLWPVDKIILGYFVFCVVLIVGWWRSLPEAPWLLVGHAVLTAILLFQIRVPNVTSFFFRSWYPTVYVSLCYREMSLFVPAIRHTDADRWLADLDFRIWHANPTIWLERIYSPALTEYLQLVYTLFVPTVILVGLVLWLQSRWSEFQNYTFLIAMGFLVSYLGYLVVPARGPRFLLKPLEHAQLNGLWLFHHLQTTLDRLESAAYDCFPSGHTELTIIAWWGSRRISKPVFRIYFAYTLSIIFATVYLRYHYTVDVLAGIATALVLICVSPWVYRKLQERN